MYVPAFCAVMCAMLFTIVRHKENSTLFRYQFTQCDKLQKFWCNSKTNFILFLFNKNVQPQFKDYAHVFVEKCVHVLQQFDCGVVNGW